MNAVGALFDHPIAHRLGWALFHSLWEGAIVWGVFAVVRLGMRRRSANARYLIACLMLGVLVSAPVITTLRLPMPPSHAYPALTLAWRTSNSKGTAAGAIAIPSMPLRASSPAYLPLVKELLDRSLPWMVQLWVVGVIGLSCRWMHGSRWIRRVKRMDVETVDPAWLLRLEELCRRLSISRPVRLLKSGLIEVPLVVGWLRPVILLPASSLAGLTPEQLEAILAHELAHVRRYDHLVNTFQNLVETLMFYHPAAWLISRCIREEREHCCDDLVVRVCGDRVSYVKALVTLEESRGFPRLALAASGGSLLQRVRRLLGASVQDRPPSPLEFGGIALIAVGITFVAVAIWLFNWPAIYQAAALIRVSPPFTAQTGGTEPGTPPVQYYPQWLETECLIIRSPAVLNRVAQSFEANLGVKITRAEALRLLKARLSPRPVPGTSVLEVQASDSDPVEAARIANAVATAYKEYRREQRRDSTHSALGMVEECFKEATQQVTKAQDAVDRLRIELKIPDAAVSENMPTMRLSAETLRHIEGLRIESQADYVKQRTLLDRLEKMEPGNLPAMITTVGLQDNQLANYLEALGLIDQKLISLQKELGPEHTEVVKSKAQQDDLRQKIAARTSGILRGLQAKLDSTGEGICALSNAVVMAQDSDAELTSRSRPYFEAKRDLEELVRFRQMLQTKIAMEHTDLELPVDSVEVVEDAVAPAQAFSATRPRAIALLGAGLLLILVGWWLTRTERPAIGAPATA